MAKHRRKRDMRKATQLMWVCIVLAFLGIVMAWNYNRYAFASIQAILNLPVLPLLFSAVFFCLYQRGFRQIQLILFLPACAAVLYQLYFYIRTLFHARVYLGIVLAFLSTLTEAAFLVALLIGLMKNDRRILRYGTYQLIASAVLFGIRWIIYMIRMALMLPSACKLLIYGLIAYRGEVTDNLALPGYPMHASRPAAPTGSAAKTLMMQGGQAVMGTKSKVVAALLAFFLGTTGAHRYYLGYRKQGIMQTCGFVSLVIGWTLYVPAMINQGAATMILSGLLLIYGGIVGIWAFVDFIRILIGSLAPADGTGYAVQVVQVAQSAPAPASGLDDLERLAKLRDAGVLTEEEFQRKKADILTRI